MTSAYNAQQARDAVFDEQLPDLIARWGLGSVLRELDGVSREASGASMVLPGSVALFRRGLAEFLDAYRPQLTADQVEQADRVDPFVDPAGA